MIGYILCEKGMIYKGIKYKENGVYFRVDGFIVFLNLESLITNMWDKMDQDSQIIMVEWIPCNHKVTNKIPIKVGVLKFLREINYSRYKIKDFNCAMFLKILKYCQPQFQIKLLFWQSIHLIVKTITNFRLWVKNVDFINIYNIINVWIINGFQKTDVNFYYNIT